MGSIYQHSWRKTGGIGIHLLLLGGAVALSACGGGGGGGAPASGPPVNRVPTVSAGANQSVGELTVVNLNGSASDPDAGDTLTFAWTQTAGQSVTINNANTANADITAPDVAAGAPEMLTFQLSVNDGNGGNATDTTDVTVQEPQAMVTISGKVQYEFVPPNANCFGLNYAGTVTRFIRQATVQIVDAGSGSVIETMASNDMGDYSFTVIANTNVFLRVRAELIRGGANPSWNVEVRDNTANTGSPLSQRPLYVLDGAAFDSGGLPMTRDLTATTGWGGASYTGVRAAAPFSVLDTIYSVMSVMLAEDPPADFPAFDVFWSVNNSSAQGTGIFDVDIAAGDLGTSFYGSNRLFLLGMENDDTEEFDDHVVIHEWGHYFEDNFSRSDSIGGAHGLANSLDMRVAFGEGFATAMSGIGLNDPVYCDTGGAGQGSRFLRIDIENDGFGAEGWYNEISVMNLLYDLWDTNNDGADTGSLGFGPINNVLTGTQALTPAFTSIFSFATELKAQNPGQAALIDGILTEHSITSAGIDIYGSTEANNRGGAADVLPVYTTVIPDGSTINICSNDQFDGNFDGNKLSTHRYLRMTVTNPSPLTFTIITTTAMPNTDDPLDDSDQSDPDLLYLRNGQIENRIVGGIPQGLSGDANQEIFTTPNIVAAGDYVIDLHEFRYEDDQSPANYPSRTCFDVTIGP